MSMINLSTKNTFLHHKFILKNAIIYLNLHKKISFERFIRFIYSFSIKKANCPIQVHPTFLVTRLNGACFNFFQESHLCEWQMRANSTQMSNKSFQRDTNEPPIRVFRHSWPFSEPLLELRRLAPNQSSQISN